MSKVKDCREEDAISFFCKNCMDKGILNAISRRDIAHFADLAAIVRKYCAMESAWKTQIKFWDPPALTKPPVRTKGCTLVSQPIQLQRNQSPLQGVELYWRDGSRGHAKFTVHMIPRAVRIFSSTIPQSTIPQRITTQY